MARPAATSPSTRAAAARGRITGPVVGLVAGAAEETAHPAGPVEDVDAAHAAGPARGHGVVLVQQVGIRGQSARGGLRCRASVIRRSVTMASKWRADRPSSSAGGRGAVGRRGPVEVCGPPTASAVPRATAHVRAGEARRGGGRARPGSARPTSRAGNLAGQLGHGVGEVPAPQLRVVDRHRRPVRPPQMRHAPTRDHSPSGVRSGDLDSSRWRSHAHSRGVRWQPRNRAGDPDGDARVRRTCGPPDPAPVLHARRRRATRAGPRAPVTPTRRADSRCRVRSRIPGGVPGRRRRQPRRRARAGPQHADERRGAPADHVAALGEHRHR